MEDRRPWSVDNVPVWHVHRRYSDFLSLFGKIRTAFPQFKVRKKCWFNSKKNETCF